MKKPRYKIIEKSVSAHCCFDATVVDTKKPKGMEQVVCECFSLEDATLVCEALNELEERK